MNWPWHLTAGITCFAKRGGVRSGGSQSHATLIADTAF
jgi:hypothetical protein